MFKLAIDRVQPMEKSLVRARSAIDTRLISQQREEFPGLGGWLDKAYSEPVTMSRATQELFYAYRKWIEVERLVSD